MVLEHVMTPLDLMRSQPCISSQAKCYDWAVFTRQFGMQMNREVPSPIGKCCQPPATFLASGGSFLCSFSRTKIAFTIVISPIGDIIISPILLCVWPLKLIYHPYIIHVHAGMQKPTCVWPLLSKDRRQTKGWEKEERECCGPHHVLQVPSMTAVFACWWVANIELGTRELLLDFIASNCGY